MKQRLFVAIPVSDELKEGIKKWQKRHADLPVRFIKLKDLHLTIIAPWYADTRGVTAQLGNFSSNINPFDLRFHTIEKRPRLLWAKGEFSPTLVSLLRELAKFLELKTEKRKLLPHLTLARFKRLETFIPAETINWTMRVASFVLMQSTLSPKGASYDVIAEFPLGQLGT